MFRGWQLVDISSSHSRSHGRRNREKKIPGFQGSHDFHADHYKDLTETRNQAWKVYGNKGISQQNSVRFLTKFIFTVCPFILADVQGYLLGFCIMWPNTANHEGMLGWEPVPALPAHGCWCCGGLGPKVKKKWLEKWVEMGAITKWVTQMITKTVNNAHTTAKWFFYSHANKTRSPLSGERKSHTGPMSRRFLRTSLFLDTLWGTFSGENRTSTMSMSAFEVYDIKKEN